MKENKVGIIICSTLVLPSGILPLCFHDYALIVNYMLAIFGSGLLSLTICLVNYFTLKKGSLIKIVQDDYFLDIQAYVQIQITKGPANSLSKSQIIDICSLVRRLYRNAFNDIELYLNSVFFRNTKGCKIIATYKDEICKSYEDFNNLYLFLTTADDAEVLQSIDLLSKHFLKIVTNLNFINMKDEIIKYHFKNTKKMFSNEYEYKDFNQQYLIKLKEDIDKNTRV